MSIAFLCMCFVATFVNFYVSRFERKSDDLSKKISTFKVLIYDEGMNTYANIFNSRFKECVENYLSSRYKLKKNDINQELLLEYVIEKYLVDQIQGEKDKRMVKFRFSLKYVVLGKEEIIKGQEIEFKIDATQENNVDKNIEIIVKKQIDNLVELILVNNL